MNHVSLNLPGENDADDSAPSVVERLVRDAEEAGASDLHLQMTGEGANISLRIDGVMCSRGDLPQSLAERVFGRIKFLARLKTYQESLPQDGRIDKTDLPASSEIRVATYPTVTGEKIVLRLFQKRNARNIGELEFPPDIQADLHSFLRRSSGLLLLTGPAGSGKTTTIYACLHELAALGGKHIITVEDPVEQILPGVMQTEADEALGLDFGKAARHLLRQDPQVLVIGEIRDEETANVAVRAALTGHLVISTLHAGSCKGVLQRLSGLCQEFSAAAASLELILNQRLLRRCCAECQGRGCAKCFHTGYRGRVPLVESLRMDDDLRAQIIRAEFAQATAHPDLWVRAQALAEAGITNQKEIQRLLTPPDAGNAPTLDAPTFPATPP
jgi:type II secretory ATPase GspE/PulE/Tfp pilus assembly ATPase PilB-like protein